MIFLIFLHRMWGFSEPLFRRKLIASLDSTSCRGLADSIASARWFDSEGSLAKCRGLDNLEKSKEKFRKIKGKVLYNRRKGSALSKESVSVIEGECWQRETPSISLLRRKIDDEKHSKCEKDAEPLTVNRFFLCIFAAIRYLAIWLQAK